LLRPYRTRIGIAPLLEKLTHKVGVRRTVNHNCGGGLLPGCPGQPRCPKLQAQVAGPLQIDETAKQRLQFKLDMSDTRRRVNQ